MITDLTSYFDIVPPDVIYKLCVIIPSFVVAPNCSLCFLPDLRGTQVW